MATVDDLIGAAAWGNGKRIRAVLASGVPVDAEDAHGRTALFHAANAGHTYAIGALLDAGARIDHRDEASLTPIMVAALQNRSAAVDVLLSRGAAAADLRRAQVERRDLRRRLDGLKGPGAAHRVSPATKPPRTKPAARARRLEERRAMPTDTMPSKLDVAKKRAGLASDPESPNGASGGSGGDSPDVADASTREPGDRFAGNLEPPDAGHRVAARWVTVGILTYFVLTGTFLGTLLSRSTTSLQELIGLGDPPNAAMFVLMVGGFLLTLIATLYVFRQEIRQMRREELDIQWLLDHGRSWRDLVLADPRDREGLRKQGRNEVPHSTVRIETLVDLAVRRVQLAEQDGRIPAMSAGSLREIAEKRTARLGSFARYTSTLLLFLTVLGTFAGVKTALPGLITALTSTDPEAVVVPLRAIADAFGGNALALIGAIAVGIMAHGVSIGRRHLIERLELVASAHIFGSELGGTDDKLGEAVLALNKAANEIMSSSGRLDGIETALVGLGNHFRESVHQLESQLQTLMSGEQNKLYQDAANSLQALQAEVGHLTQVVGGNAYLYGGLVEAVGARSRESDEAVKAMRASSEQLNKALGEAIQLGTRSNDAFKNMEDAAKSVADGSKHFREQVTAMSQAVAIVQPAIAEVRDRLSASETRSSRVWTELEAKLAAMVQELSTSLQALQTDSAAHNEKQLSALTREITKVLAPVERRVSSGFPLGHGESGEPLSRVAQLLEWQARESQSSAAMLRNGLVVAGAVIGALLVYNLGLRLVTAVF